MVFMVAVINLDGTKAGDAELPQQFHEAVRGDLIMRAVLAERSEKLQPKGADPLAGMKTTAEYYGRRGAQYRQSINTGRARLPREKLAEGRLGRVRMIPSSVKGRRAHPPKPWKKIVEHINSKESMKAVRSAIAATASGELVRLRGHRFEGSFPVILSNDFESLKKTKDVEKVLSTLKMHADVERATSGRKKRTGIAGRRRGGYRVPKSILFVVNEDRGISKAARNIPGADVANVRSLRVELLAPGGAPGRLTVWSEGAVKALGSEKLYYAKEPDES
jgi:large subunit ribosomal protein L4e